MKRSALKFLMLLLVLGCIQSAAKNTTLVIDNVEYQFANDIGEAQKIPVDSPGAIRELMLKSKDISIIFDCSGADKPQLTVAAFNAVSTVQNYLVYSRSTYSNFRTYCFVGDQWYDSVDMPIEKPALNVTLWFKSERTGAASTGVSLVNNTVIVQGTNYKNLTLATDAFNLAFLGVYKGSANGICSVFLQCRS